MKATEPQRVISIAFGLAVVLVAGAALSGAGPVARADGGMSPTWQGGSPALPPLSSRLSSSLQIRHVLERLSFGPRPGDVERVAAVGLQRWIERQLEPETIDDSDVASQLAPLTDLSMPNDRLMLAFYADNTGFLRRQRAQAQQAALAQAAPGATMASAAGNSAPAAAAPRPAAMAMSAPQMRLYNMVEQAGFPYGISMEALGELEAEKVVMAVESKRQLQEELVDFWTNHFNLDCKKGPVRTLLLADQRDVIRPHVLGRFRDLLEASAKSPAMLFYLDNARSSREYTVGRRGVRIALANRLGGPGLAVGNNGGGHTAGGINENYGRELMELHTLGVDGGYTQNDVQEVARCFTGWTLDNQTGQFRFRPFMHDNGAKIVLGHEIPAGGGIQDGETVLDILASSPATAHHLATELCMRFVADEPPPALVDRVARRYMDSGGDLREVMRAIVSSPEFYADTAYRAKIKSPFEFAVSAIRAMDGHMVLPDPSEQPGRLRLMADGAASANQNGNMRGRVRSVTQQIALMGEPLFSCQPPTGYPEDSRTWVSAGALIARLNYALALTSNRVAEARVAPTSLLEGVSSDDHDAILQRLSDVLVGGDLSPQTRAILARQLSDYTPVDVPKISALILGSPEFQRR